MRSARPALRAPETIDLAAGVYTDRAGGEPPPAGEVGRTGSEQTTDLG
jgi:hypothetical protein